MIWYFEQGLQLLVRVKIEQSWQKLDSFKKIVKNIINAKTIIALRPYFYICKTNQYYRQDNRPEQLKLVLKAS